MELATVIGRKNEIRTLPEPVQQVKQRIAQAAEELSRAGDAAIHVEILNEVLCRFVKIVYQKDEDGVWSHLDRRTQRIFPAKPWGSAGWRRWGLRQWEAKALSRILVARALVADPLPLFDYNTVTRNWHVNINKYRSMAIAMSYLEQQPISLAEWRKYRNA